MNSTLPQSLSWQGFREGSSTSATVSIQDYYDCDGSKGIHAVMLITGQPNCGACKSEAATLEAKMGAWAGMGIKVVTLMIGSVSTAQTWKSKYGLNKSAVLADKMPPALAYSSTIGTPMHHIVDPRTMKVIHTQMGAGGSAFSKLEQLATANKK
jgi:peroxiredoxin